MGAFQKSFSPEEKFKHQGFDINTFGPQSHHTGAVAVHLIVRNDEMQVAFLLFFLFFVHFSRE